MMLYSAFSMRCLAAICIYLLYNTACMAQDASAARHALLDLLDTLPQKTEAKVICGQVIRGETPSELDSYFAEYYLALDTSSGKLPAMVEIMAHDEDGNFVSDKDFVIDRITALWDTGTVTYLSLRPPNPENGGSMWVRYDTMPHPADLSVVYTESTSQNLQFKRNMDSVAVILEELKNRGIPVFFESFNEANHNVYWWSWDPDMAKKMTLWKYCYNYFTNVKGLDNLIWVLEYLGGSTAIPAEFDSLVGLVDIIGLSIYDSLPEDKYRPVIDTFKTLFNVPVGFSESGPNIKKSADDSVVVNHQYESWDNMILIDALKNHYPEITFFNRWSSVWSIIHQQNDSVFMNDPLLLNREQLYSELVQNIPTASPPFSDSEMQHKIRIFPNPATSHICFTNLSTQAMFTLMDLNGRQLCSGLIKNNHIDISFLAPGFYLLQLKTDKSLHRFRLVVAGN